MRDQQTQPIKVLLIEDNPGDARLIKEYLGEIQGKAFAMDWADRLSEGLKHVDGKDVNVLPRPSARILRHARHPQDRK